MMVSGLAGLIEEAKQKISQFDAEIILANLLGISRAELYIYEDEIGDEIINKFDNLVQERATGKPLQYIIGKAEFMGLEFIVTPDVFIPRPETELLVETAIEVSKTLHFTPYTLHLLDLGTGSGNIAISLTKILANCKMIISDISAQALSVAARNAGLNLVGKQVVFVQSDIFENLKGQRFDIIVSNPPYVATADINALQREIGFEPRIALDGGLDGLDFYRRLIKEAGRFLTAGGYLALELGFGQAGAVRDLLKRDNFKNIRFIYDYNSIKRVAVAQWTG